MKLALVLLFTLGRGAWAQALTTLSLEEEDAAIHSEIGCEAEDIGVANDCPRDGVDLQSLAPQLRHLKESAGILAVRSGGQALVWRARFLDLAYDRLTVRIAAQPALDASAAEVQDRYMDLAKQGCTLDDEGILQCGRLFTSGTEAYHQAHARVVSMNALRLALQKQRVSRAEIGFHSVREDGQIQFAARNAEIARDLEQVRCENTAAEILRARLFIVPGDSPRSLSDADADAEVRAMSPCAPDFAEERFVGFLESLSSSKSLH